MKKYYIILGILLAFTGIGAVPAGIGYLSDTSGAGMRTSTALLANSPLKSFLLPGLFLLFINGLGNLFGSFVVFTRNRFAGVTGLVLGTILVLWISIQVYWITLSSFMQPLFFAIGIAEAALGWFIMKKETGQVKIF